LPPHAYHRIQVNYLGTNSAGTAAVPNGGPGIELVRSTNVLVGGDTAAAANVIGGNVDGVRIDGAGGTKVLGNFIGTNAAGATLANTGPGVVVVSGAVSSTVRGNVIARNGGDGVRVLGGDSNAILSNSIHSNGGLGIDLGGDGVTPNDTNDADTGPNDRLNFPVLTSVLYDGNTAFVRGTLNIAPGPATALIQLFISPAADPSGYGEGATFYGETTVNVGTNDAADFSVTLPGVQAGQFVSATASAKHPNAPASFPMQTSEFSAAVAVPPADLTAPTVSGVYVNGTAWSDAFRLRLQNDSAGDRRLGYAVPGGADQLRPLPWINANEITLAFGESVNVRQDHLLIRNAAGDVPVASFASDGRTATWRLALPLGPQRLTLTLKSAGLTGVTDQVERPLDGEWADGADAFPSGNGAGGGNFVLTLNVLPGDVNGTGSVLADDFSEVKKRFFKDTTDTTTGDTSYSPFHDVDGSGSILADDYSEVKKRFFDTLPADAAAPFGATRVADEVLG
jgi:parallel beta-helix repeat protein